MIAILFLILAIGCYSLSQLQQHGKLKCSKDDASFWGKESHRRKYKYGIAPKNLLNKYILFAAKENLYTNIFKIKYREAWPTSTWLTVAVTDGYHLCQFMFFNFLSLSFAFALSFSWITLGLVWVGVHLVHAGVYRLLSR